MANQRTIYLDYAAATPVDPAVVAAMRPYFSDKFYNPSAAYLASRSVAGALKTARHQVAQCLGVRPGEIVFIAGGTEANNLAIQGVMQAYPQTNLVVSAIEHDSVLKPAKQYDYKLLSVEQSGLVNLVELKKKIDDHTVLVSIGYANNEIGTVQPLKAISRLLYQVRTERQTKGNPLPLYFHTDACQAPAYLDIHANRLGVDMMTLNGGKIYGPKQSGVLYVKTGVNLHAQIQGGGQEHGLRSGTENVAFAAGFAKALQLAQAKRADETKRLKSLQKLFFAELQTKIPQAVINGSLKHRLPNNVHITVIGQDNERLVMALDEQGVMCAVGSACSASSEEPSHVLKAIGLSDSQAQASLRFTMGRQTSSAAIRRAAVVLTSSL